MTIPHMNVYAAGLFLYRDLSATERVWLLLQNSERLDWGFPKGHQEAGEVLWDTAVRECSEECGIALLQQNGSTSYSISYPVTHRRYGRAEKTVVYYPAKTLQSRVRLSKEHKQACWFSAQDVCAHLHADSTKTAFQKMFNEIV